MNTHPVAARPKIVVLLAAHDGDEHLGVQVRSILDQRDVDVRLIVSDDIARGRRTTSLARLAADDRIVVLPARALGSARANFLRLIADAHVGDADAIAFSDQDDEWLSDKLVAQFQQLRSSGAAAVSGNVTAVFGSRRVLLHKAQPQRRLDFVCESAGPGSTYLLRPETFEFVRSVCAADPRIAETAAHDWIVYAIVRAAGMRWHIDPASFVEYRQHGRNVIGANVGMRAALERMTRLGSGDFRGDCALVAEITSAIASDGLAAELADVAADLRAWDPRARWRTLRRIPALRRRRRERVALEMATLLHRW